MADENVSQIEEWRKIEGWPYEVSSLGRVRRITAYRRKHIGKTLKGTVNKDGYFQVSLCDSGRRISICIHQLVCAAFHGPQPSPEHEVAHWNGNKTDNTSTNLRWATSLENSGIDARRLQEILYGERNANAKLKLSQIAEIREKLVRGAKYKDIVNEFGISMGHVHRIRVGTSWG